MSSLDSTTVELLTGVGGLGLLGLIIRATITWFNKQDRISQGDSVQKEIYQQLSAEAKKWAQMHNEMAKQYEASLELISQLRMQNAMMRMMLIQSGVQVDILDNLVKELKPSKES